MKRHTTNYLATRLPIPGVSMRFGASERPGLVLGQQRPNGSPLRFAQPNSRLPRMSERQRQSTLDRGCSATDNGISPVTTVMTNSTRWIDGSGRAQRSAIARRNRGPRSR